MTQTEMVEQDSRWIEAVRGAVAGWGGASLRDLPWRGERDPYRVLVSEMMLIQTTVTAAAPYYRRFLELFPTIGDLAAAEEEQVLKAWEGLGYYRRARQLHAACKTVVERHDGEIPADRDALLSLPGVGPYIAGAVLSFAFDLPAPILEANTQRLLARLVGLEVPLAEASRRLWDVAAQLTPPQAPGKFNQNLMDLGALICKPAEPTCLFCPLTDVCHARRRGKVHAIPVPSPRTATSEGLEAAAVLMTDDRRILVVQRPSGGLWSAFWEFPTIHVSGANPAKRVSAENPEPGLGRLIRDLIGESPAFGPAEVKFRYAVTRYKMGIQAHPAILRGAHRKPLGEHGPGGSSSATTLQWMPLQESEKLTFSSPGRRILEWARSLGSNEIAGLAAPAD